MGKLFGTDGIRGIANESLDCRTAFKVGQAAAVALTEGTQNKPVLYIGKDTRISSDMLEAALVAGVTSAGADAVLLGVAPTPAVAYLTKNHADAGVMISASHNPFEYNGIKMFSGQGYKLSDELEEHIEMLMQSDLPVKKGADIGRVVHREDLIEQYIDHLASVANVSLDCLRIAVDCANGAASRTARKLFGLLGADELDVAFDEPNGVNINVECGSTALQNLQKRVVGGGFDIGIAFDGDADRCLIVGENGAVLDGDRIMAVCGLAERDCGQLDGQTIVATVMSNLGFHVWARQNGLKLLTASVGDRYVLEEMLKGSYQVGGEQSGHVIFLRHATTGDGQLTAIKFLSALKKRGCMVSQLVADIPQFPQILINVEVRPELKDTLSEHPDVSREVERARETLGENGRVLVRASGTEALVRVMIEGQNQQVIGDLAEKIANVIKNL